MNEEPITWRHAIQYSQEAKELGFVPQSLAVENTQHCTLVPLTPNINFIDIRDWIYSSELSKCSLSGIFLDSAKKGSILLPHLIRFTFANHECAFLFRLTWV